MASLMWNCQLPQELERAPDFQFPHRPHPCKLLNMETTVQMPEYTDEPTQYMTVLEVRGNNMI